MRSVKYGRIQSTGVLRSTLLTPETHTQHPFPCSNQSGDLHLQIYVLFTQHPILAGTPRNSPDVDLVSQVKKIYKIVTV